MLQTQDVEFERYGHLPDRDGLIKDTLKLHYGKSRSVGFGSCVSICMTLNFPILRCSKTFVLNRSGGVRLLLDSIHHEW